MLENPTKFYGILPNTTKSQKTLRNPKNAINIKKIQKILEKLKNPKKYQRILENH